MFSVFSCFLCFCENSYAQFFSFFSSQKNNSTVYSNTRSKRFLRTCLSCKNLLHITTFGIYHGYIKPLRDRVQLFKDWRCHLWPRNARRPRRKERAARRRDSLFKRTPACLSGVFYSSAKDDCFGLPRCSPSPNTFTVPNTPSYPGFTATFPARTRSMASATAEELALAICSLVA